MGFTKLDERILQSSIMAEDPFTFKIWITLLAACKSDGITECSALYLESICRIPLEQVYKSLEILSNPDKNSRSVNDNGKRIERVDGGYKIINYLKYRDLTLKSAEAERKRLYREKNKCPDAVGHCPDPSASVSASASDSASDSKSDSKSSTLFEEFRKQYPGTKRGFKTEYENFCKKHKDWKIQAIKLYTVLNNQLEWRKEMKEAGMFIPQWKNLQTWINQRCWEEEKPIIEKKNSPVKQFGRQERPISEIMEEMEGIKLS